MPALPVWWNWVTPHSNRYERLAFGITARYLDTETEGSGVILVFLQLIFTVQYMKYPLIIAVEALSGDGALRGSR